MSQTTPSLASVNNDWDQIEATIAAFEAAWIRGERPTLAEHIDEANPLRSAILVELIHADLEFRLKAGEPARVEAYLATYPELNARSEALVSLIRTEWAVRQRTEPDLLIDRYLARFPHLADLVATSLVESRSDRPVVPPRSVAGSTGLDAPLPRRLGKYELQQKVGEGAFGFVFRARDTILQHDVALKIPRPEVAASPVDLLHFLREAKNAIHLRHPNIVAIQDAGPIDGTVCLISEFIEGMTLADRLRVGPLGVAESVQLMVPILEALSHAHRRGIIHRDLKPSNILLDHADVPHLTDFGLAKRATGDSTLSPMGASRVLIGTPAYMAPEQARGDSTSVAAASDVYTAGVVLYEMLTGSVPFGGRGRLLQLQIEEAEPRPPRDLNDEIPPDLETICLRALAKYPADRYRSAGAMADDLANFRAGQPIAARRFVAPRLSFWSRHRGKLGRVILGLAGCGVVAGLGWEWWEMKRRLAVDSTLIERLIRESVEATRLPPPVGSNPAEAHRRLTNAIWDHSRTWLDALANRPALAEYRVDLLIQAANHAAEVGADPATRVAWQEVVEALEPFAQSQGAASPHAVDLARALTELGELHANAGSQDEARRCFERAVLTWNRVAEGLRDQVAPLANDPATRLSLAEAILHGDRAARLANQGGTATAVAEAELIADELRLQGHLAAAEVARLGEIQLALARRYQAFGQPNHVAFWGGRAVRSARSVLDLPDGLQANVAVARADLLVGLATADGATGVQNDLAGGAVAQLQAAIATFTQASHLDPTNWLLQRDLAKAQSGLAALLTRRCRHDAAARWFTLALQTTSDLRAARPDAHVDLAAAAEIHAGLARIDWHRNQTWAARRRTIMAVFLAHRAARLAPGIAAYRQARTEYALTLLPMNHPACSGCFPSASPAKAIPAHREIELP